MTNLPEFGTSATPVARKDHRCTDCAGTIPRGRRYVSYTGRWDGEVATYRFHRTCWDIRIACQRHLASEAGGRFTPEEMPAFGRLVEWTTYDAHEGGGYFPPWWPQHVDQAGITWGVYISAVALAAYVETRESREANRRLKNLKTRLAIARMDKNEHVAGLIVREISKLESAS